jgi:hypothetical protein
MNTLNKSGFFWLASPTRRHEMSRFLVSILICIMAVAAGAAENPNEHEQAAKRQGVEALSPGLRDLLTREMLALQQGMMSVIPAYASGDWKQIEIIAAKIKNSYILQQSLTDKQKDELHSLLPQEFIEKDEHFHYLAGMLEHVAQTKKPELVNFYFSEMNQSCADCHAAFATHRFPAFRQEQKKGDHAH